MFLSPMVHKIFAFFWDTSMYIFTYTSTQAEYDTRFNFEAEFNRFEFKIFLLFDWLPYQD